MKRLWVFVVEQSKDALDELLVDPLQATRGEIEDESFRMQKLRKYRDHRLLDDVRGQPSTYGNSTRD